MTTPRTPSDDQSVVLFGGDPVLCRLSNALAHVEEQEREVSRAIAKDHGIRFRDLAALDLIARSEPQGIRTNTLARELELSTSRLAHQVASLERRKLITRAQHGTDGRGVVITLTPAGRKLHAAAIPAYREIAARVLPVGPDAGGAAPGLLGRLDGAAQRWNEDFAGACVVALSAAPTTAAMVERIGTALCERVGFSSLVLLQQGGKGLDVAAAYALPGTAAAAAKTATAISTAAAGLAADQLRAIVCATATEIADAIRGAAKVGRSPLATVVALPLTRDGRLVGVLVATSQAPGVADETALRALEAAGRVCAIRLDLERAFTSRSRAAGAPAASVLVTGTTVAV